MPVHAASAALALVSLVVCVSDVGACQFIANIDEAGNALEPPPWEDQIKARDVLFVGTVVDTEPNTKPGWPDRVFIEVEIPIRGDLDARFETEQGNGGDCGKEFLIGQRLIFAGNAIWDPTVYLSDPLTAEQEKQLDYVEALAEE